TPRGQYALDLYFTDKYEVHKLTDEECRLFAVLGHRIINKYVELGIHNINIVFNSSPLSRQIRPVTAHFVPRVNKPALYELLGRDVVDTFPSTIFTTFLSLVPNWRNFLDEVNRYNPADEYERVISSRIAQTSEEE
ncbi:MAG: hypothetical protein AABZ57_03950, partial [Candidatus Margulisiibacteriota bacterium]